MYRVVVALALAACGDNARSKELMRSGSRLELITYELADGSHEVDRTVFHDTERDEDCSLVSLSS